MYSCSTGGIEIRIEAFVAICHWSLVVGDNPNDQWQSTNDFGITMLNIFGRSQPLCDRVSRRAFLQVGGLALGGMSLPQILRAEQASGFNGGNKGVIMIFLPGGPSHQDMWDIKMDAPAEIRGEFTPIATKVPGVEICELFPRLASISDKLAFIRSMVATTAITTPSSASRGITPPTSLPAAGPRWVRCCRRLYGSARSRRPPVCRPLTEMRSRSLG